MAARERMSGIDHAWLRMERPTNLMMITGVFILRDRLALETLRQVIATRFLHFRRFRQRVVSGVSGSWWEDDPYFDVRRHVVRVALPGEAGKAELEELVSDLMATPLDRSKPIWQYYLVEGYQGGSAVVARIHHCYADGIALAQVLLGMTDAAATDFHIVPAEPVHVGHADGDFVHRLFQPMEHAAEATVGLGRGVFSRTAALAANPLKALGYAGYGFRFTSESAALTLMPGDSPTRFKGRPGPIKRAVWAEPLPLSEVRSIGHALGCSINDVLLASAAGALREYLIDRGDSVEGVEMRAVVPVNMRMAPVGAELGNRFALVFLSLPLYIANPLERIYHLKQQMHRLRHSTQPVYTMALMLVTGSGPQMLQDFVVSLLSQKASAVMTNVPGPQQQRYLGGAAIDEIMFWVPQSGDIGMGVSIMSYNGRVHFGLATDVGLVPDPDKIIDRFGEQFEQLLLTTLMQVDWGPSSERHEPIGPR